MDSLNRYWVVPLSEVEYTRGRIRWERVLVDCRHVIGNSGVL